VGADDFGAGERDKEPFLRPLRRAERSDSGVEGFANVLDSGCGLRDSASDMRIEMERITLRNQFVCSTFSVRLDGLEDVGRNLEDQAFRS